MIQPQTVKIIAQIIVVGNVLARLTLGVRLQPEPQFFERTNKPLPRKAVKYVITTCVDQIKKCHQVGRRPPLIQIGIAETQITFADQTREDVGVVDVQLGYRSGLFALGTEATPIG